ncbi:hypothetical protein Tco_0719552 [Tanacetum coccineum]
MSTNIVGVGRSVEIWSHSNGFLENTQEIQGDDKIAIFIGLNRDLTIEIKNESWNNRFVDFKETIEANVYEETLDVVGFVVGLINNTTFAECCDYSMDCRIMAIVEEKPGILDDFWM